ncbi:g354 [Coccomyxa elongata]
MEAAEAAGKDPELGWQATARLSALRSMSGASGKSSARVTTDSQMGQSLLTDSGVRSLATSRRASRAVKRDSLATAGSLGPIHRRTSSIDALPSMSLPASFSGRQPGGPPPANPPGASPPLSFRSETGALPPWPAAPGGPPHAGREGTRAGAAGNSALHSMQGGSELHDVEMASLQGGTGLLKQT